MLPASAAGGRARRRRADRARLRPRRGAAWASSPCWWAGWAGSIRGSFGSGWGSSPSVGLVDLAVCGAPAGPGPRSSILLLLIVVAPFVVVMLLGAMLPSIDFDVLEYHLQGPKEYYQAGRIAFLAAQRLHQHAVRRGDAPPAGHGGAGRLVVGRAGGPAPGCLLRAGGRRVDRRDDGARRARRAPPGSRRSSTCRRPGSTGWPCSPMSKGRSASITPRWSGAWSAARTSARSAQRSMRGLWSASWPAARWAASTRR